MSSRKTITLSEATFERSKRLKEDGESWSEFQNRVLDIFESADSEDERKVNALTVDHIDDIANAAARRTVDELEALRA